MCHSVSIKWTLSDKLGMNLSRRPLTEDNFTFKWTDTITLADAQSDDGYF